MAEIRMRNAGPQVIKTLDRASIVNDRIIEHSLRTKESFTEARTQGQARPDAWAQSRMGGAARQNVYGAERTMFRAVKTAQHRILHRNGCRVQRKGCGVPGRPPSQRDEKMLSGKRLAQVAEAA